MKAAHDYLWPQDLKTWHYWTEWRFREHCAGWNYMAWAGGANMGKAQPLWSKIKTPTGWVSMGNLKIGDSISDTEGGIQQITAIHPQGEKEIYKITFSDGAITHACGEHLWQVQSKKQRDHNQNKFHIYTTLECIENLSKNLSIPYHSGIAGIECTLPIHPWLLGYYIGNGSCRSSASPTITTPTLEIANRVKEYWPESSIKSFSERNCFLVSPRNMRNIIHSFSELNNKKSIEKLIPPIYFNAPTADRLYLLQGLMDADGSISNSNNGYISLSNKDLAYQVLELARSLGFVASMGKVKKTGYKKNGVFKKCCDAYTVYICAIKNSFQPFKYKPIKGKTQRVARRTIKSIKLVGEEHCQCITVSNPNSLYITDDYIVTHNSVDAAKIANLYWLANRRERAIIVSSTTLESLGARVWGYVTSQVSSMKVKIPFSYTSGNSPKILVPSDGREAIKDTQHGMFALASKGGDAERSIKDWIGRHPKDGLLIILDEATSITANILESFANLDMGETPFQVIAIGNSESQADLHGAMATPKLPMTLEKIDIKVVKQWETTRKNGTCLYFNPYESPAIHEVDPEKRKRLAKFLMTAEQIEEKKAELGEDSDAFWRFVMGFWKLKSTENVIASKQFIESFGSAKHAHYSGIQPLNIVGGLDLAFATGGDNCLLRLAVLGLDVHGLYTLDFREQELLFKIPILRTSHEAADIQIARAVLKILGDFRCPLENIAIDSTGQGRAMGGVLQLMNGGATRPLCIYSTKNGVAQQKAWDVVIKSTYDLWFDLRSFIQHQQVRGLDPQTIFELSERLIEERAGKRMLEAKADYKKRLGAKFPGKAHSPDYADAAALAVQAAIVKFGFALGKRRELPIVQDDARIKYLVYKAEQAERAQAQQVAKPKVPTVTFKAPLETWVAGRGRIPR